LSLAVIMGDFDRGISTAPRQRIAPSIRFGISAARTRPATNARITESLSEGNGVVWSGRRGCTFTHETPCVGFSIAVLKLPCNGLRLARDLAIGMSRRRRRGMEPIARAMRLPRHVLRNFANKYPAPKTTPRIRFGINATTTRPAISTRVTRSISEDSSGVWSARVASTDDTPCDGCSMPVLRFHCRRSRTTFDLAVGTHCRRR